MDKVYRKQTSVFVLVLLAKQQQPKNRQFMYDLSMLCLGFDHRDEMLKACLRPLQHYHPHLRLKRLTFL
jgi:hypothetical protein